MCVPYGHAGERCGASFWAAALLDPERGRLRASAASRRCASSSTGYESLPNTERVSSRLRAPGARSPNADIGKARRGPGELDTTLERRA